MTINPKLLEPTLLWENPNPASDFTYTGTNNPISVSSMQPYKYIILEYKANRFVNQTAFMKLGVGVGSNVNYCLSINAYANGNAYCVNRPFVIPNYTQIFWTRAYSMQIGGTGSENDSDLIPVRIYGTNIL